MNKQKGAISTAAAVAVVIVILVIAAIAYWYVANNPGSVGQPSSNTSTDGSASNGGSSNNSVATTPSGNKQYSNFKYGYAVSFPANAQNNISNPENVSFGFKNATGTPDAVVKITVAFDVTHIGYCLTVPQGAAAMGTTSVNGVGFLSYKVGATSAANTGTTYYRILHKGPAGNACYDIQKFPQGSATLNEKLNNVLQSFTFITSAR